MKNPVIQFSIIIPTCNRIEMLRKCLEQLQPGKQENASVYFKDKDAQSNTYEVIVSDDGSDSNTEQLIQQEFPWVHYTPGPQKGPAANRNHGAKQGHGQWLIFIDDDCVPSQNVVQGYASAIEKHPECKSFEGAIHAQGDAEAELAECPVNTTGGNFWSANVAIEKKLFNTIKGFDEGFPYPDMEDCDIYHRIQQKTSVPFLVDVIVHHPVRMITVLQCLQKQKKHLHSVAYFTQKTNRPQTTADIWLRLKDHFLFHSRNLAKNIMRLRFRRILLGLNITFPGSLLYLYLLIKFKNKPEPTI